MDKLFFCVKVMMIKKVAWLAFLESRDKKEALITSRRQAEGGAPGSQASVLWLRDNQISENAWTLILRSCWRRNWRDKQVWLHIIHGGWQKEPFDESAFSTVFLFPAPSAPTHPAKITHMHVRTHTGTDTIHSLRPRCYRLHCVPRNSYIFI